MGMIYQPKYKDEVAQWIAQRTGKSKWYWMKVKIRPLRRIYNDMRKGEHKTCYARY